MRKNNNGVDTKAELVDKDNKTAIACALNVRGKVEESMSIMREQNKKDPSQTSKNEKTTLEVNSSLDGINSMLDSKEKEMSELLDMTIETIQHETKKTGRQK